MKGFTLIELLAVIVILSIILLISVPLISDVIKNSKNAALESSAKSIKKAAKDSFMNDQLLGKEIDEVIYVFEDGIQRTIPTTASKLEISGEAPKNGYIRVNKETADLEFNNGEKTIIIDKKNKKILKEEVSTIQLPIIHKCGTPYTDTRDGKIYNTVKIGNECWFSDDLAYTGHGCLTKGWNDNYSACRVTSFEGKDYISYQRNAYVAGDRGGEIGIKGVCPAGFRLPSMSEIGGINKIFSAPYVGFHKDLLKNGHNGGTNLTGFNIVLSGEYGISENLTCRNTCKFFAISNDLFVFDEELNYLISTINLTKDEKIGFGLFTLPGQQNSTSVRCILK